MAVPGQKKGRGGKRANSGRKGGQDVKDPRAVMKDFGYVDKWLSPLEFCLAVMNGDMALIDHSEKGRGRKLTLNQRILAARVAAPYFHQKLPELVEQNVTHSWADMVKEGEERLRTMRKDDAQPFGQS